MGDSRLQLLSAMTENFTHRLHLVCTDGDLAFGRCIRVLFALSPNSTPSSSDLKHNVASLDPSHASNKRHCKASAGIDTVFGKWSMASSRQKWCTTAWGVAQVDRIALASSAPSLLELWQERTLLWRPLWIGVLQCILPLLEIVFRNWDSVRVGGPALNVAAIVMRMQTDRESKRVRLDGWSLHEDPTANAESSGDETGAHDGRRGGGLGKKRKEQSLLQCQ